MERYCRTTYNRIYAQEYPRLLGRKRSPSGIKEAERAAQQLAIKRTFQLAIIRFPNESRAAIWDAIYSAHVRRKAGRTIPKAVIDAVVSADQSWRKSSGHAFEHYIAETTRGALNASRLKFVLQKELQEMIKKGDIHNDPVKMRWLKSQVKKDVFDLYAIYEFQNNKYVYGVIQSKTSIRDRVSRDREPSIDAMNREFWSVAVTLNGDFFRNEKFKEMVNGGSTEFPTNGWHGMYVMSEANSLDRIYRVDDTLSLLVDHAIQASQVFTSRQNFDASWIAQ